MRTDTRERATAGGRITVLTLLVALALRIATGHHVLIALGLLAVVFVPLEKAFALRPQRVLRRGLLTDLTHFAVNNLLVAVATIVFVVGALLPYLWIRRLDIEGMLPTGVAVALAVVLVFVGQYWGHRLTHQISFLWRFHAVHHSIEQMDWVASARVHPLDSAFTQAFTLIPLVLLGYRGGTVVGVSAVVVLIALFQHANVRLRFPVVRWLINTPEWHHWHHSVDTEARDKNFGLPVVDLLFGTAYMPRDRRPAGFGTDTPVPDTGYLRHLVYPFSMSR
jgi:sterol desaturase/sphingolipid hydroxylase (fatty acid hydroxylase superfamily)